MITCYFEDGNKAFLRHATVDVLVLKENKILLVKRNKKLTEGGKWGLTGGYLDRDETIKQGGEREVLEESGWTIRNMTLLTISDEHSNPNENKQNIKFVFFSEAVEEVGTPDWESDEVRWFPLDQLPPTEEIAFDHPSFIELYKKYRREGLQLPILT